MTGVPMPASGNGPKGSACRRMVTAAEPGCQRCLQVLEVGSAHTVSNHRRAELYGCHRCSCHEAHEGNGVQELDGRSDGAVESASNGGRNAALAARADGVNSVPTMKL